MTAAEAVLNLLSNQGGWGRIETKIGTEAKAANFTITNCVTARRIKSSAPSCYFLAGYFEGFCERLSGARAECTETTCKATGDAVCKFQVKAAFA